MERKQKRQDTPKKSQGNSKQKLIKSFVDDNDANVRMHVADDVVQGSDGAGQADHASASGGIHSEPPLWFQQYERRLNARLDGFTDSLRFHEQECNDKLDRMQRDLDAALQKIDDLENRSRRNNLVFFNIPENDDDGEEGRSCKSFMADFLEKIDPDLKGVGIERAHRTPSFRPSGTRSSPGIRPIHVCFSSFETKEKVRKKCVDKFKAKKHEGTGRKLFCSDDYSKRVQAQRKALLPKLKELQKEGKKAFFVFPAIIKFVENQVLKTYTP